MLSNALRMHLSPAFCCYRRFDWLYDRTISDLTTLVSPGAFAESRTPEHVLWIFFVLYRFLWKLAWLLIGVLELSQKLVVWRENLCMQGNLLDEISCFWCLRATIHRGYHMTAERMCDRRICRACRYKWICVREYSSAYAQNQQTTTTTTISLKFAPLILVICGLDYFACWLQQWRVDQPLQPSLLPHLSPRRNAPFPAVLWTMCILWCVFARIPELLYTKGLMARFLSERVVFGLSGLWIVAIPNLSCCEPETVCTVFDVLKGQIRLRCLKRMHPWLINALTRSH